MSPSHPAPLIPTGLAGSKGSVGSTGEGCGFAAMLDDGILVSQPSPCGKGAPKERIGQGRYERQMRKAEKCAAHVEKA